MFESFRAHHPNSISFNSLQAIQSRVAYLAFRHCAWICAHLPHLEGLSDRGGRENREAVNRFVVAGLMSHQRDVQL